MIIRDPEKNVVGFKMPSKLSGHKMVVLHPVADLTQSLAKWFSLPVDAKTLHGFTVTEMGTGQLLMSLNQIDVNTSHYFLFCGEDATNARKKILELVGDSINRETQRKIALQTLFQQGLAKEQPAPSAPEDDEVPEHLRAVPPEHHAIVQQMLFRIEHLEMSSRAKGCLVRPGLLFLGDLVTLENMSDDLRKLKGLGKGTLQEIIDAFESLKEEDLISKLEWGVKPTDEVIAHYKSARLALLELRRWRADEQHRHYPFPG